MGKRKINNTQKDRLDTIKNSQLAGMTYKEIAEEYLNYLKSNNINNDDNVELETLTSRVESWFYGRSTVRREFVDYLRVKHHINPSYISGESNVMTFPFDVKYDVLLDLINGYSVVSDTFNDSVRRHSLVLSIDSHFVDYLIARQMQKQADSDNDYSKEHSEEIQNAIYFNGEEDSKEYILVPCADNLVAHLKYQKVLSLNNRVSELKKEKEQLETDINELNTEKLSLENKIRSLEKLIDRIKGRYDTYVDTIISLLGKFNYSEIEAKKMRLKLESDLALIEE